MSVDIMSNSNPHFLKSWRTPLSARDILRISLFYVLIVASGCHLMMRPVPRLAVARRASHIVYIVRSQGETLASVSERYTGSQKNWKTILAANKGLDAKKIKVGSEIKIPVKLLKPTLRTATAFPTTRATKGSVSQGGLVRENTGSKDSSTRSREEEILPGNGSQNVYKEDNHIPVIKDPMVSGSAVGHDSPSPRGIEFKETVDSAPHLKPSDDDAHAAEEEKLKRRYEVLMDLIDKEENSKP